jgi:hypothetical protein
MPDLMRNRARVPSYLESLECLLHDYRPKSAHYVGYAHREVLTRLLSVIGAGRVSAMDYWNRYGLETEFDYDTDERVHDSFLPEELKPITFFIEGSPPSELLIWDMPWHFQGQLEAILEFKPKQPPHHILLADEAMQIKLHSDYAWQNAEDCLIGIRKAPYTEFTDGWSTF